MTTDIYSTGSIAKRIVRQLSHRGAMSLERLAECVEDIPKGDTEGIARIMLDVGALAENAAGAVDLPARQRQGWVTLANGQSIRQVVCPYCVDELHTFALASSFDPNIEALHCDFASLCFDVGFRADGTPEPISQSDPRFTP